MQEKFQKYLDYKEKINFNYKGYPVEKILSVDIASIAFGIKKFRLKGLFGFFFSRKIVFPEIGKNDVLYSMGDYKRKDYYALLDYVREQTPGHLVDLNDNGRIVTINVINILKALVHIFSEGQGIALKDKLMLVVSYTYIMNYIDEIERNESALPGAYVSFCSSHINEAVIDIFFQKRSIPTYTLQHGLYFLFKDKTIDAICYENIIANKLLCWGEYTREQFVEYGVSAEKLIVAGYPGTFESLKKREVKEKFTILLLLSRYMFHENNIHILNIVSSVKKLNKNINIDVKMHPSLKESDYHRVFEEHGFSLCKEGTIKSLLKNGEYDMTISYNSTAYYDSYMSNCVSLRYLDKDSDGSIDVLDDGFDSVTSLSEKIAIFSQDMKTDLFWRQVEERLAFICGFNINKYNEEIKTQQLLERNKEVEK
ncbi:hypothetical protein Pcaca05_24610 [Pectobacterium carotovorum subsp. carotovorum]|nr:hypothetical protein Pcaca05_24610 [Pectobacterium carotovorum subsp. carotovorum]